MRGMKKLLLLLPLLTLAVCEHAKPTAAVVGSAWLVLGAVLEEEAEAAEGIQEQLVGLGGLATLAAGTVVKAGLAVKKARKDQVSHLPSKPSGNANMGSESVLTPS